MLVEGGGGDGDGGRDEELLFEEGLATRSSSDIGVDGETATAELNLVNGGGGIRVSK